MRTSAIILMAVTLGIARPALATESDTAPAPETQLASLPLAPSVVGIASWYGGHHAGRPTASGEIHSTLLRTAAHRNLPLGTFVLVTNLKNGLSTLVKVNDRGPFTPGRILDLSERAAKDLAMISDGLARVRLEVVTP